MTKQKIADLHIHSVYSDGILTPDEIFKKAQKAGLSAISITDHDTVAHCHEALALKDKYSIDIITGIEISCFEDIKEYHILGYDFDPDNRNLKKHVEEFKHYRFLRAKKIIEKLNNLKKSISIDDVLRIADKAPIIRPHIAQAMLEAGYVKSLKEAFRIYLGDWKPAYVPKKKFPVESAIKLINDAGGVASLAHPALFVSQDELYTIIQKGIDGIETCHPLHDENLEKYYHTIASQYWLLETGGSDYHGTRDYDEYNFGHCVVPYSIFESIRYHSG